MRVERTNPPPGTPWQIGDELLLTVEPADRFGLSRLLGLSDPDSADDPEWGDPADWDRQYRMRATGVDGGRLTSAMGENEDGTVAVYLSNGGVSTLLPRCVKSSDEGDPGSPSLQVTWPPPAEPDGDLTFTIETGEDWQS